MPLVALAALAILILVWVGRGGGQALKRREWRIGAGAFSVAALAGAALLAVRDAWIPAAALGVVAVWLALAARRNAPAAARPEAASRRMSLAEAGSILGVGPDATPAEVRAAHKRLIRRAHPDTGGTSGLAAQLNAARDRLLERD